MQSTVLLGFPLSSANNPKWVRMGEVVFGLAMIFDNVAEVVLSLVAIVEATTLNKCIPYRHMCTIKPINDIPSMF